MLRRPLVAGLLTPILLLLPSGTVAGGVIEIADSVAGLSLNVDLYGLSPNTAYTVSVTGPDGNRQSLPVTTTAQGTAETLLRGETLTRAGTYSASLQTGGTQAAFTVYPDEPSASISQLAADRTTLVADGDDRVAAAVHLVDRFGNGIADRPIALVASRSGDDVVDVDTQTDAEGWQRFFISTTKPGTFSLRATDLISGLTLDDVVTLTTSGGTGGDDAPVYLAQLTGTESSIVDHFEISLPNTLNAGIEAQSFTVTAVNRNGDKVADYLNRIRFRSSDPQAELPGLDDTYKFVAKDQGTKTFALALKLVTPGTQSVTVEDANDPSIKGSISVTVIGDPPGGGGTITIERPAQGSAVGGSSVTVIGTGPPLVNLVSSGGLTVARGATMQDGSFALTIPIPTDGDNVALSISDDTGRYRSPVLRLVVDRNAPTIDLVSFSPAQPVANQSVTASVKTAATDVGSVAVTLSSGTGERQKIVLAALGSALYQGTFTAGAAGNYQVIAEAADLVGNTGSTLSTLGIRPLAPSNVRVSPKGQLMEVTWTASQSSIDGYRVYIGEQLNEWEFGLDTRQTSSPKTTTASIKDLDPGKPYYFAVSAVIGDLESDFSPTAQQTALGLNLDVQPADSALVLRWNSLPREIPISGYLLRFGLKPDALTEERLLPSTTKEGTESYVIGDLINGLTYSISLTPIANGNPILELTATGKGTPNGLGKPLPGTPAQDYHGGAPTPEPPVTGPALWFWIIAAIALFIGGGVQWIIQRQNRSPVEPR